ncbi:MAG: nucleotide exchange factor GrpE [Nocardioidaceae bacterium]
MTAGSSEYGEPVFRDKRRIDPETGQVREPRPAAPSEPARSDEGGTGPEPAATPPTAATDSTELEATLAERTADLQRLQAEYVNYKRRVDRDRELVKDSAVAAVLTALLPVLDDIGRAREHDELSGGFKAVAESLERIVTGLGLEPFGTEGDPFDPKIHEALMHRYSDDVTEPVAQTVLQVGYRLGERIMRPARVAVVEPEHSVALSSDGAAPDDAGATPDGGADDAAAGPPVQTSYEGDDGVDTNGGRG